MKRLKIILLFAILFSVTFYSCNKIKDTTKPLSSDLSSTEIKDQINDFYPEEEFLGLIYKSFLKNYNYNNLKESVQDVAIDTLLWQTETYLNTQYGFSKDSIFKNGNYFDTISLTINGYTSTGIPIVDGQEASDFINDLETAIILENEDEDNVFFWCVISKLDSIHSSKVSIIVTSVLGNSYSGVYPPGWDPTEFAHYTCMKAGGAGYCDQKWWWGANLEYNSRYEMGGISHDPDYIFIQSSAPLLVFHDSPGVNGRLWADAWTLTHIMHTGDDDELNTYLLSTKDLIDDYNPMGSNNMYLGNVDVYAWIAYPEYNLMARHALALWYFQKVYIGPSGE